MSVPEEVHNKAQASKAISIMRAELLPTGVQLSVELETRIAAWEAGEYSSNRDKTHKRGPEKPEIGASKRTRVS